MPRILVVIAFVAILLTACDEEDAATEPSGLAESKPASEEVEQPAEAESPSEEELMEEFHAYYAQQMDLLNEFRGYLCDCGFEFQGEAIDSEACRQALLFSDEVQESFGECMVASTPDFDREIIPVIAEFLKCGRESQEAARECLAKIGAEHDGLCGAPETTDPLIRECESTYSRTARACQDPVDDDASAHAWFERTWRNATRRDCRQGHRLQGFPERPEEL